MVIVVSQRFKADQILIVPRWSYVARGQTIPVHLKGIKFGLGHFFRVKLSVISVFLS